MYLLPSLTELNQNYIAVVANMFFIPLGILFHTDVCGFLLNNYMAPSDVPIIVDRRGIYPQVAHRRLLGKHYWGSLRRYPRYIFLSI